MEQNERKLVTVLLNNVRHKSLPEAVYDVATGIAQQIGPREALHHLRGGASGTQWRNQVEGDRASIQGDVVLLRKGKGGGLQQKISTRNKVDENKD